MKNRPVSVIVFVLLILTLNSCAGILIKAAYNQADWFIKNEIDKLFDITWSQDSILSDGLDLFLNEHRQNELPLVYDFMENLEKNTLKERITIQDIYQTTNEFIVLRNRLFNSLLNEEFSEFISTLKREQVDYFAEEIVRFTEPRVRDGKTFRERSDRENHDRLLRRRKENMITWFGEVTPRQEKMIDEFPLFDRDYWEGFYLERNRVVKILLDQLYAQVAGESSSQKSVDLFRDFFTRPREKFNSAYLKNLDQRIEKVNRLLVELHSTLTPEQKKYFQKQVDYYQDIVSDLIKAGKR